MTESASHKRAKAKAAGPDGETEVPIKGERRLDAATKLRATEVERSGSTKGLKRAVRRLRDSGKNQRVLLVPQKDMNMAVGAMKEVGVSGTVSNLSGTKKKRVKS